MYDIVIQSLIKLNRKGYRFLSGPFHGVHMAENIAMLSMCIVFVLIGIQKIRYPGIHYDEVLFGNAALGMIDSSFVSFAFHGVPIHLMAYIGALKAYIYYPIFAFFGVSYETIRIPSILLTAGSLIILCKATQRLLSTRVALITLALLSVDPSLIAHTRTDIGPTALEFFLKIVAFYSYVYFLTTKRAQYVYALLIALFLGVFNKLNFIWTVNAFVIGALLLHRNEWITSLKQVKFWRIIFILLGFLLTYVYFVSVSLHYNVFDIQYSSLTFTQHVTQQIKLLSSLLDGSIFYLWMSHIPLKTAFPTAIYTALLICAAAIVRCKMRGERSVIVFILILNLVTAMQIVLTRSATAPWHTMSLYPFITILSAISIDTLAHNLTKKFKIRRDILVILFVIPILISSALTYSHYLDMYQKPISHPAWSNRIDEVIEYTKLHKNTYVSIDWGIHNQLRVMNQHATLYDHWGLLNNPLNIEQEKYYVNEFLEPGKKVIFITHGSKFISFPSATIQLQRLAEKHSIQIVKIKDIREGNDVLFEFYQTKQK